MTNKQSYVHKGCTGKVCFLDSSDILFHFISCKVGRRTQPSFIHLNSQPYHSNTRWFTLILYDPCFKKNSSTSAIKWLATKKDLGPFKIDRAVVDSNRSVNLLFNIRKILFTYPRKGKDTQEVFKCFRSATCHRSWLEGWLASGAEICLFHGRVVEKTRLHKAFWWTILFQLSSICLNSLQILEAKARIFVWHWTKSLSAWSYSNSTVTMNFSRSTTR